MRTEPILIIELNQPDPRKRGQAYGEAARESIHSILDKYREIFQRIIWIGLFPYVVMKIRQWRPSSRLSPACLSS